MEWCKRSPVQIYYFQKGIQTLSQYSRVNKNACFELPVTARFKFANQIDQCDSNWPKRCPEQVWCFQILGYLEECLQSLLVICSRISDQISWLFLLFWSASVTKNLPFLVHAWVHYRFLQSNNHSITTMDTDIHLLGLPRYACHCQCNVLLSS